MSEQIAAIKNPKTPKIVEKIQSLMGLVNFYSRFSNKLATLAYQLHNQTKRGLPQEWDENCHEEISSDRAQQTHDLWPNDVVLSHQNLKLPIILATVASTVGLAGCSAFHIRIAPRDL